MQSINTFENRNDDERPIQELANIPFTILELSAKVYTVKSTGEERTMLLGKVKTCSGEVFKIKTHASGIVSWFLKHQTEIDTEIFETGKLSPDVVFKFKQTENGIAHVLESVE